MPPAPRRVGQMQPRRRRAAAVDAAAHPESRPSRTTAAIGAQDARLRRRTTRASHRSAWTACSAAARETARASAHRPYPPSAARRSSGSSNVTMPMSGQVHFARIRQPHGDHLVPTSQRAQALRPAIGYQEVRDQHDHGRASDQAWQDSEDTGQVRRTATRCGAARRAGGRRCVPGARDRRRAARWRRVARRTGSGRRGCRDAPAAGLPPRTTLPPGRA